MRWERELQYMCDALQKCRIQTFRLDGEARPEKAGGHTLGQRLGLGAQDARLMREFLGAVQERRVYHISDRLMCRYLLFRLPEKTPYPFFFAGPYLTREPTRAQLLEVGERLRVPASQFRLLENFYALVPVLAQEDPIFALTDALCERLWGAGGFDAVDVDWELSNAFQPFPAQGEGAEDPWSIHLMEQRYGVENELMQAVGQGSTKKAERLVAACCAASLEPRVADPVRNWKNYCIILNTLLRKAAEQGGVHPVHLDSVSAGFANRIEEICTVDGLRALMLEMVRSYCQLVRKNAVRQYSPQIQRALVRIDSDLSGDLSLKRLAQQQNINASYLSTLFKRETGQTVTQYVNHRRVQLARQLLSGTHLQVQTIAQHCGIPDVNYFSKLFKKYTALTPKEYRKVTQEGKSSARE